MASVEQYSIPITSMAGTRTAKLVVIPRCTKMEMISGEFVKQMPLSISKIIHMTQGNSGVVGLTNNNL